MKTIGVFLSDIHMPDNINLEGVFKYIKDLKPNLIILGGDIIDAKGMHGIESMQASQIKMEWYERDCKLLSSFLRQLHDIAPQAELVYLEGNHEERYSRIMKRYPDAWGDRFSFFTDVVKEIYPKSKWISYGTYDSYYKLGDTIFTHGTVYPENHAKKYAQVFTPFKVVYGHLHHFQAHTIHSAMPKLPAHYAVTAGCLSTTAPEWKKGQPNCWINGFIDFVSEKGITTPTVHLIEKGKFTVAGREYK
jgi:predicted phosphodiesterase